MLAALAALPLVFAAPGAGPDRVAEILTGVLSESTKTPEEDVLELARMKTAEAFAALKVIVESEVDQDVKEATLESMAEFAGDTELCAEAIRYVHSKAKSKEEDMRLDATYALLGFGDRASAELEQIVRKSKDPICRAYALRGIIRRLQRSGQDDDLELILDNCHLGRTLYRYKMIGIFGTFDDFGKMPLFEQRVRDTKRPPDVKTAILEALASSTTEGVDAVFAAGLRDREPMVQFAAIEALRERYVEDHAAALQRLAKSDDRSVSRAALLLLASNALPNKKPLDPFELATQRSAIRRQVAAECLANERSDVARDLLHELVTDDDRSVRAQARLALVEFHQRESVPVLIGLLTTEEGVAHRRTLEALRLLTGLDHGGSHERWSKWWLAEGETFELPTLEEARAIEAERGARRAANESQASFYGLQIESRRLSFVVDVSGSMRRKTPAGRRRIDVAYEELTNALGALPDGALVNVILFEEEVYRLNKSPVELDAKTRAKAAEFLDEHQPGGETHLYEALELAFEDPRIDTVYLLTDGRPSGGLTHARYQLLHEIARWNEAQHAEVHTVSVDGEQDLLQRISEHTGGTYALAD